MTDTPMANPQLTCDHHYISYHQGDFPKAVYWVRICELCQHIIPEMTGTVVTNDNATVERVARSLYECKFSSDRQPVPLPWDHPRMDEFVGDWVAGTVPTPSPRCPRCPHGGAT